LASSWHGRVASCRGSRLALVELVEIPLAVAIADFDGLLAIQVRGRTQTIRLVRLIGATLNFLDALFRFARSITGATTATDRLRSANL
jgi:hypothetical protein